MPFPLGDLKRSYGRSGSRGGTADVRPYLLAGKELATQRGRLLAAIEWLEAHAGRSRAEVPLDELAQLVGDYRLARCLQSCLESTFRFQAPDFEATAVEHGGGRLWTRLLGRGVDSASALRLHVFDAVNARGGFAAGGDRDRLLEDVAASLGAGANQIEHLLWLDADEHARLTRTGDPPDVDRLAAHYNRRALETLLVRTVSADVVLERPDGAAIKRLYFAVKRAGLLCELELEDRLRGPQGGVRVRLFGPLEVFGPRTRHGDRFARALLELLVAFPELHGTARVLVNEREYGLHLPPRLADTYRHAPAAGDAAPEAEEADPETAVGRMPVDEASFDSEVEAHLFRTLRGMARKGDARGWTVQREPEPIVHDGTVMVPDFLLSRGEARVFVEVMGFWTPAYRERKRAKLLAVAGHVPLVLAVQEQIAGAFADVPLPQLTYKRRVSGTDLVRLLDQAFGSPGGAEPSAAERTSAFLTSLAGEAPAVVGAFAEVSDGQAEVDLETLRARVRSCAENGEAVAEHLEALLPRLGFEVVWRSLFEATVRPTSASPSAPRTPDAD